MPVKAACSFSFQCVHIIEWQVKKPHTVVGILIPVCLSHVKQFQMGPALCRYNTASALWHGKNALSPSGSEKGHWRTARASLKYWGFDRDTGRWVVVSRPAQYRHWGCEGKKRAEMENEKNKRTRVSSLRNFIFRPKFKNRRLSWTN